MSPKPWLKKKQQKPNPECPGGAKGFQLRAQQDRLQLPAVPPSVCPEPAWGQLGTLRGHCTDLTACGTSAHPPSTSLLPHLSAAGKSSSGSSTFLSRAPNPGSHSPLPQLLPGGNSDFTAAQTPVPRGISSVGSQFPAPGCRFEAVPAEKANSGSSAQPQVSDAAQEPLGDPPAQHQPGFGVQEPGNCLGTIPEQCPWPGEKQGLCLCPEPNPAPLQRHRESCSG